MQYCRVGRVAAMTVGLVVFCAVAGCAPQKKRSEEKKTTEEASAPKSETPSAVPSAPTAKPQMEMRQTAAPGNVKPLMSVDEIVSKAEGGEKPNILVIFGDDIGMWNISAYHRSMMGGENPEHRSHRQ